MNKRIKIYFKIPATSANLGSGFDLIGLALNVYNEFFFDFFDYPNYKVQLYSKKPLPFTTEQDLIRIAYKQYFLTFLKEKIPIPYHLELKLQIPLKSGLGSSATAILAGFCLGREIHKIFFQDIPLPEQNEFLLNLIQIEGHLDNLLPAYLGGVVWAYCIENRKIQYYKKTFPNSIRCFLLISPENIQVSTKDSRQFLPQNYNIQDVLHNMSRFATWIEFLYSKKASDLRLALEDKIQTPYRLNEKSRLFQFLEEIKKSCIGYSLSGSGPATLIYFQRKYSQEIEKKIIELFKEYTKDDFKNYRLIGVKPIIKGLQKKITFL